MRRFARACPGRCAAARPAAGGRLKAMRRPAHGSAFCLSSTLTLPYHDTTAPKPNLRGLLQVRRFSLEKWLNEPFFEDAVVGAAARVAVRSSYMMAVVAGVVERPPGVYKCARARRRPGRASGNASAAYAEIELGATQCPHTYDLGAWRHGLAVRSVHAPALLHHLT